jgi:hypothetical protein
MGLELDNESALREAQSAVLSLQHQRCRRRMAPAHSYGHFSYTDVVLDC